MFWSAAAPQQSQRDPVLSPDGPQGTPSWPRPSWLPGPASATQRYPSIQIFRPGDLASVTSSKQQLPSLACLAYRARADARRPGVVPSRLPTPALISHDLSRIRRPADQITMARDSSITTSASRLSSTLRVCTMTYKRTPTPLCPRIHATPSPRVAVQLPEWIRVHHLMITHPPVTHQPVNAAVTASVVEVRVLLGSTPYLGGVFCQHLACIHTRAGVSTSTGLSTEPSSSPCPGGLRGSAVASESSIYVYIPCSPCKRHARSNGPDPSLKLTTAVINSLLQLEHAHSLKSYIYIPNQRAGGSTLSSADPLCILYRRRCCPYELQLQHACAGMCIREGACLIRKAEHCFAGIVTVISITSFRLLNQRLRRMQFPVVFHSVSAVSCQEPRPRTQHHPSTNLVPASAGRGG